MHAPRELTGPESRQSRQAESRSSRQAGCREPVSKADACMRGGFKLAVQAKPAQQRLTHMDGVVTEIFAGVAELEQH